MLHSMITNQNIKDGKISLQIPAELDEEVQMTLETWH